MNIDPDLSRLLPDDAVDAGCAASLEVLHHYVELELSGAHPEQSQPGVATHLRNCAACREDHRGLLDAVDLFGDAEPSSS